MATCVLQKIDVVECACSQEKQFTLVLPYVLEVKEVRLVYFLLLFQFIIRLGFFKKKKIIERWALQVHNPALITLIEMYTEVWGLKFQVLLGAYRHLCIRHTKTKNLANNARKIFSFLLPETIDNYWQDSVSQSALSQTLSSGHY